MNMKNRESGQAIIELTIMLVAITTVILGLVFLSGYEITNNQLLLEARNRAQLAAKNAPKDVETGNEFYSWNYPAVNLNKSYIYRSGKSGNHTDTTGKETLFRIGNQNIRFSRVQEFSTPTIPFASGSSPVRIGTQNSVNKVYISFNDTSKSSLEGNYEHYHHWRKLDDFDNIWFEHDFSQIGIRENSLDVAALVARSPVGKSTPATLSSREQAKGRHSKSNALSVIYDTFSRWFGIKPEEIKLDESISNRVYMPQTCNSKE